MKTPGRIRKLINNKITYEEYKNSLQSDNNNEHIKFIMNSDMSTIKDIYKAIKRDIG